MRRVLLLVACLVLLAGCANVPLESQPVVVSAEKPPQQANNAPEPPENADPLDIVRLFIKANADPRSGNAASRAFLDERQRSAWKPTRAITIIDNTFSTVYDTTATPSPTSTPPADPNVRTVSVRGSVLGTLSTDSTFIPGSGPAEQTFQVRKQANGQWRISSPPPVLLVTDDEFNGNYNRVAVSFYSPDSGTFVPDLRYVAAKPQSGMPGRVMDLILAGPSAGLTGAVKNLLGDGVSLETNVKNNDDGSLTVPLSGLNGASPETRSLIAAQIVLSMQTVTSTRIRLLADGAPLVRDHEYWRSSDVPAYSAASSPSPDLMGMMTVGGRIRSLGDGAPIPGPAGSGAYAVVSGAQSIDGKRLAVVEHSGGGVQLRIGDMGRDLPPVELVGGSLSRPTWRPAPTGAGPSGEVWTVVDHAIIARMVLDPSGRWLRQSVNANDLLALGQIGTLRLSRDGARVAATVNGQLVVASVVRTGDTVTLREPRVLQPGALSSVADVDWGSTPDTLVATTSSPSQPVERVSVDGRRMDAYNSSNLTAPVRAVAAAPSRPIVVADGGGLWNATELGEVWRPQAHTMVGADPFYPG
ncbi:LpqB family beta-propeller domain-containing protein [Amycolatopsis jejuensis]|uniref:LpqB family beta-propeller domain-containing protein n=1 Tax=Amycolatopsis jejuensis TaxID=330084 RepID=UPI000525EBFE|nr:LpqB family beta-propeller domain-containing protein [Amycolatopsis jejuensis]